MIDTNKYEGHTEGKWKLHYDDSAVDSDYLDYGAQLDPVGALPPMLIADAQLIADAPLLLAEVKRLRDRLNEVEQVEVALWNVLDNWNICMDDYSMHDQYENLDERYAWADWGIILKELYTYTEEDGWQLKEVIE